MRGGGDPSAGEESTDGLWSIAVLNHDRHLQSLNLLLGIPLKFNHTLHFIFPLLCRPSGVNKERKKKKKGKEGRRLAGWLAGC